MKLRELFDPVSAYHLVWHHDQARFKTHDNREIRISFHDQNLSTASLVEITFSARLDDPMHGKAGTMGITGAGDAPRIFATVLQAIQEWLSQNDPDYIMFTADEPSRQKLYRHMVKRLAGSYHNMSRQDYIKLDNDELPEPQPNVFLLQSRAAHGHDEVAKRENPAKQNLQHNTSTLKEGFNQLHDNKVYQRVLSVWEEYYGQGVGREKLHHYSHIVDQLNQQGGTVYRALWIVPGQKPNLDNPGKHWSISAEHAREYFESTASHAAWTDLDEQDAEPYIISATVGANSISNKNVLLSGFPDEFEVNIVGPAKFKIVGKVDNPFADLYENLVVDVPNQDWLNDKRDYVKSEGPDSQGVPRHYTATAWTTSPVELPVSLLKRIPGARNEQSNVRPDDLKAIRHIMKHTGRLPQHNGRDYVPFIVVTYDGQPWVSEGNHRIMAAAELGWETLPVDIRYFEGGEQVKHGPLYPEKIGL